MSLKCVLLSRQWAKLFLASLAQLLMTVARILIAVKISGISILLHLQAAPILLANHF